MGTSLIVTNRTEKRFERISVNTTHLNSPQQRRAPESVDVHSRQTGTCSSLILCAWLVTLSLLNKKLQGPQATEAVRRVSSNRRTLSTLSGPKKIRF